MLRDRSFSAVLICFALSGLAGLIYETIWTEQFALVFGASELAVSTVLGAYMAGLAAGAALAHRWVNRIRNPVRVYALLELGIAASALAVPVGLRVASQLQQKVLGDLDVSPEAGSLSAALFYAIATFVILFVPTALMGATLPLLARHAVHRDAEIGPRIGWLYAANTTGAAVGTVLAAFVLLPNLGLGQTVFVAVGVNALVFALAARLPPPTNLTSDPANLTSDPGRSGSSRIRSAAGAFILPVILLSGFVSFTWEVLWTRLLSQLLGGTVYAFGAMLGTFLLGIGIGSAIASRLATDARRARVGFAVAQFGLGVLSYAAYRAVDMLPGMVDGLGAAGGASLFGGGSLAALTLLPGAVCVGATFPFAVRILTRGAADAGSASARVYAWNTVGSIIGAISAGFVLLPWLGFAGTATLAVSTSLILAAAVALSAGQPTRPLLAVSAVALATTVAWPPQTPWRVLRSNPLSGTPTSQSEVLFFSVGRSANVLVNEERGRWRLSTNGLPEAAVQPPGSRVGRFTAARWMSLLPLLSRPETRSLLVVGMGAGLTLEDVPESINEIHVVELEPEVVAANRLMAARRENDPLSDPRLQIHVNDARSALTLSNRRLDAIVSQPSHPWTSGSSHLFTREFFSLVGERLSTGGVFVQWMGLAFIDADLLRTLVATLCEVFEYVEVYQPFPGGSLLFLGSQQPLSQPENIDLGYQHAHAQWRRMGLLSAQDVLLDRRLTSAASRRFSEGAALNTDYRNRLKIRSPKILGAPIGNRGTYRLLAEFDPLFEQPEQIDLATIRRLIERKSSHRAIRLVERLAAPERMVASALVDLAAGRGGAVQARLRAALAANTPASGEAMHALLQINNSKLASLGIPPQLQELLNADPHASAVVEGWRLLHLGDLDALQTLETALAGLDPSHALYGAATALRIDWRQRSSERERAQEALALLEPRMAFGASPGKVIQWIQLARIAEDQQRALAGASDLVEMVIRNPKNTNLRRTTLALVQALPLDWQNASYQRLLAQLKDHPGQ